MAVKIGDAAPLAHPWVEIGQVDDVPRRGARRIDAGAIRIALFRTATDDIHAVEDRCPHRGGPLSQGIVHDGCVTCPLHNMVIALDTGEVLGPDEGQVRTFATRVAGGRIFIDGDAVAAAARELRDAA